MLFFSMQHWLSDLLKTFQPSVAMWHVATAAPIKHAKTVTFVHVLGDFSIYSRS
jgi:hypothetical protein